MDMLATFFTFTTLHLWQWQSNEGGCPLPFYDSEVLQINAISRICPCQILFIGI